MSSEPPAPRPSEESQPLAPGVHVMSADPSSHTLCSLCTVYYRDLLMEYMPGLELAQGKFE